MGCDGCELWSPTRRTCYAGVLHELRGGRNVGFAPSFEVVTPFPGRMATAAAWPSLCDLRHREKPWLDGLPRLIFVSDMSDAMSRRIPFEYLESEVIRPVSSSSGVRHCWLWLTKQPQRMREFSTWLAAAGTRWPRNLWVGTSVTTQATAKNRVKHLLEIGDERTVRFVSVEPQLEAVDLAPWLERLHWVIQGGESGTKARDFDVRWARAVREQCEAAGVAYFLKQLGASPHEDGEPLRLADRHGGDWSEWPRAVRTASRKFPRLVATKGTYIVVLELKQGGDFPIRGMGPFSFPAGFYIYVGSAFQGGGLHGRLGHHAGLHQNDQWQLSDLRIAGAEIVDEWAAEGDEPADMHEHALGVGVISRLRDAGEEVRRQ